MISVIRRRSQGRAPNSSFEVCAVCGTRHGPTYDFRATLRHYGMTGSRANVDCIRRMIQDRLNRAKDKPE